MELELTDWIAVAGLLLAAPSAAYSAHDWWEKRRGTAPAVMASFLRHRATADGFTPVEITLRISMETTKTDTVLESIEVVEPSDASLRYHRNVDDDEYEPDFTAFGEEGGSKLTGEWFLKKVAPTKPYASVTVFMMSHELQGKVKIRLRFAGRGPHAYTGSVKVSRRIGAGAGSY